ncbi:rhodanese-like domain-containing protein [Variovorax arabinosiphilus]|uniref:rhodanese-like domain-containing protein n=1 Tax=Variovorax arabinosiphilus TaxID=3053498 RepID=UPI0025761DBC|nr:MULTISPECIES: rhodanese-like domain-containing protein [unclassified Variovorax]MDM0119028.1 rhodanese-like domain-containing protein [Variovorax sp. J2L1-78]MDM0129454.1 rhodanese-like domain-containing protein [Variovorax sp. J2L1-63]MDM0232760.1 rhodanese-like domain-containing protein [Variovorax sp. J2R1-6]
MTAHSEISETISTAPATRAPAISAGTLHQWLQDGRELALLDIREHGQYGEGHPFFSVHAGYSRLEPEVARLVPRRATRTVLFDDGDANSALAHRAASRLEALGYDDVWVLAGGAPAWERAGHTLFKGVNLPSKTFGEIAEHAFGVPHISARELAERQRAGEPLVLVDGRTLEEHRKMTLPGAIPVPNGELALRWRTLVSDPATPIVVHCAGRTRSIVGAQILRDLGVPNPVLALENGTQGWALAGLELERGSTRTVPPAPEAVQRQAARDDATAAARHAGVPVLTAAEAQAWLDDGTRTTFVFDVRTAGEFAAGGLQGARHAPGGQLLQATDLQVGVRHARILVLDDDGVRAPVVALWLRRLGLDAALVEDGLAADLRVPARAPVPLPPAVAAVDAEALSAWHDDTDAPPAVLDLRPSPAYRAGHARGAVWSIRPRVVADAWAATGGDLQRPVLLIAPDETVARLAALDLREGGWQQLSWARAEVVASAGWAQQATPTSPPDAEAIDFLLFVHDRHDGNLEAARRYLDWELGLIAQCAPEELASFRVSAGAHHSPYGKTHIDS